VLNMADLHVGKIGWKVGIFMKQMYNTLNKIYVLFPSSKQTVFGSSILRHCLVGFALRMKTWCLIVDEQSYKVGMHKAGAKGVDIAAKLGH
jgi:hypothetical protein